MKILAQVALIVMTLYLLACGEKTATKAPATEVSKEATSSQSTSEVSDTPAMTLAASGEKMEKMSDDKHEKEGDENKEMEDSKEAEAEAIQHAKKYGCTACHGIDKKKVGPAWTDVAKKYKNVAGSRELLIKKVKKGGKGNWAEVTGGAPMPPYSPRVPDEEIEEMVDFILTL